MRLELARAEFLLKWIAEAIVVLKNILHELELLGHMTYYYWHEKIHGLDYEPSRFMFILVG